MLRLFSRLQITLTKTLSVPLSACRNCHVSRQLHTSVIQRTGLLDFFDERANWGSSMVNAGRPWRMDELRIKSNVELHELWYVLLKERNMVMTMEDEHNRRLYQMVGPERLEKVEESMENLLWVVEERNKVFAELESGSWTGPVEVQDVDVLGRPVRRITEEHDIPRTFVEEKDASMWSSRREELLKKEREREIVRKRRKQEERKLLAKQKELLEERRHVQEKNSS